MSDFARCNPADAAREAVICSLAGVVEFFHAHRDTDSAHAALSLMETLIRGRSPEMVSYLERQRGLDLPACANEERSA